MPFYGGGKEAAATVIRKTGKRSIVASLRALGTGKNLTAFSRMLFVNPPANGAAREQAIGRAHRQGQLADGVEVERYQHTDELTDAFWKARGSSPASPSRPEGRNKSSASRPTTERRSETKRQNGILSSSSCGVSGSEGEKALRKSGLATSQS